MFYRSNGLFKKLKINPLIDVGLHYIYYTTIVDLEKGYSTLKKNTLFLIAWKYCMKNGR